MGSADDLFSELDSELEDMEKTGETSKTTTEKVKKSDRPAYTKNSKEGAALRKKMGFKKMSEAQLRMKELTRPFKQKKPKETTTK